MTGKELKKHRISQGLTRPEMAKKTGFDPMHIYKMETGRAKVSAWMVLILLGKAGPNDRTK